jgi:hypothetical protein
MEDTYILIGLSVLFICCIYLFYLNFKNAREREYLQVQINDLKFELTTRSELLNQQQQHAGSCDLPASVAMFMQQQQNPVSAPVPVPVEAPSVEIIDDEQLVDLAPEDIEKINKLSEETNNTNAPLNDLDDIELDDIELDDIDIEQFDVDDLDLDLDIEPVGVASIPDVTSSEEPVTVLAPADAVESGDADGSDAADVVDINLKTLTKNELLNSSVKYLKLIAKNCGVSSRGNKDALIAAISKKLEL